MKNQFIQNPSQDFIDEVIKEFTKGDGYVNIDEDDIKSVMKDASNVMMLISDEVAGPDRAKTIMSDLFPSSIINGYDFNSADNLLLNIEYPASAEATIDETCHISNELQECCNKAVGLIWGASVVNGNGMRVKVLATNLKKA